MPALTQVFCLPVNVPTSEAPVTTAQQQTYADVPTKVVGAADGFLFRHHAEFAADVEQFVRSRGGPDE
jgi:hypothetical protein